MNLEVGAQTEVTAIILVKNNRQLAKQALNKTRCKTQELWLVQGNLKALCLVDALRPTHIKVSIATILKTSATLKDK
jgi:hypothetical protein